jgi:hypothetical protein
MSKVDIDIEFDPAKIRLTLIEPWGKKNTSVRNYSFTLEEAAEMQKALGRALRNARRSMQVPQ